MDIMAWNGLPMVERRTEVMPDLDEALLRKLCPPYKVILHNDDHNDMFYVMKALIKSVPSLSEAEAEEIMLTAHNEGTAVIVVVPQETAEFYQERILSFGIGCTIEPDD
jgi:ATP-dependent Clp protease adaptor protein ClpS